MKTRVELADIIRPVLDKYIHGKSITGNQAKALTDIVRCRTAELGGHVLQCSHCGKLHISYNSCRNTNCPKCGGVKRLKWMLERSAEMPPVAWYHHVFTVPYELNGLFLKWPKVMYPLLFHSAWETINSFASNPKYIGAPTGMLAVLHTWGQNLQLHPHLHCIVPGGGISPQNQWKICKNHKSRYLFPVKALSVTFRGVFTDKLIRCHNTGEICMPEPIDKKNKGLHPLYKQKWVVFCKSPQKKVSPVQLIKYLSRYVNRTAISNERITEISSERVTFDYKDYRDSKTKSLTLDRSEFIRRFLMHILPKGFRKIRYYGILSSKKKKIKFLCINLSIGKYEKKAKIPSGWEQLYVFYYGKNPMLCPCCNKGLMERKISFSPIRGDPKETICLLINKAILVS